MSKVLNVLLAAAGGFIAGILLAPKSGKETREDIKNKATEYKHKADDGLTEVKKGARLVKDEVVEGVDSMKNIAQDAGKKASQVAGRVNTEVSKRADSIRKDVTDTSKAVKNSVR